MHDPIAELYRVFQPYRLGDDFFGCSHCVSQRDVEQLSRVPLRELQVSDLNRYAFKAMTTWGEVRHFKHFLPRLLELSLDDFLEFDFPEVLLGKLAYAKWETWPSYERQPVEAFLMQFWRHHLQEPGDFPHDDRIQTALGGLAECCPSLQPFLHQWPHVGTTHPALHLAQLVDASADGIMTNGSLTCLWGDHARQWDEIAKWLSGDESRDLLMRFSTDVTAFFPLVMSQLDGIRAAASAE